MRKARVLESMRQESKRETIWEEEGSARDPGDMGRVFRGRIRTKEKDMCMENARMKPITYRLILQFILKKHREKALLVTSRQLEDNGGEGAVQAPPKQASHPRWLQRPPRWLCLAEAY